MYPCRNCNKVYSYHSSLARHLKHECGVDPKFHCPLCSYRTKHRSSLNTHLNNRHIKPADRDFTKPKKNWSSSNWTLPTLPSTSGKDPTSTRRLRSTTYGDDGFYATKGRVHRLGPRKYLCRDCGDTFTLKASLTRHQALECRDQMLAKKAMKPGDQPPKKKKKHTCKRCGRIYAFYTSLWRHLHYECGMEPKFSCEACPLRFAQKSNLERHFKNMHTPHPHNITI
ncbi:GSCOCG00002816001-RA-CDS [Cotesia congregata]|nr:GSCOCG00002816001-RA-CDS [Cotesia congregata]